MYDDFYDPAGFYDDSYRYVPTIGAQESVFDPTFGGQYSDPYADYTPSTGSNIFDTIRQSAEALGKGAMSPRGLMGILGLLTGILNKAPAYGGGAPIKVEPRKFTRTIEKGKYGPIAQYAAQGGLMHAYAHGGAVTGTKSNPLPMEDGGFVMTAKAVENGGGPRGIAQLLPGARHIVGRGTGTSDDVPATIAGTTPARVSNGEVYVPKATVDKAGGAPALYALMHQLQRRA